MSGSANRLFDKDKLKKRLPLALLAGAAPSLMFFFFGIVETYLFNREEFMFSFGDFGLQITLISLASWAAVTLLILLLPDTASRILTGVSVWITVMGFIQSMFLNGSGSLGKDTDSAASNSSVVINSAIWIAAGIVIIGAAIMMKKMQFLKPVFIIALIMIVVMLLTSCVTGLTSSDRESANTETEKPVAEDTESDTEKDETKDEDDRIYLTTDGLTEVSSKNIVIFLIDRFDINNYNEASGNDPELFAGLDGFTCFTDNVSLYSRTYPAITTMITGIDNDFSGSAESYFENAYVNSPFLKDLKKNGYSIKLYLQDYYCYRDAAPLVGIADNTAHSRESIVTDRTALIGKLISLSAYKYLPVAFKGNINISSASFTGIVTPAGSGELYEVNDPVVCGKIINDGLTLDSNEKSYTFIHLSGCHSPYNMDENANPAEESSAEAQLRGCMKMIYSYIGDMKKLGVYDDATIVITGDHPSAISDFIYPAEPRLTALFVKPAGSSGDKLKYSSAQVSQENFIPTLVKSAGIETDNEYGRSYFEVPEGETVTRYHKFELSIDSNKVNQLVIHEVTGDGTDFSNWRISEFIDIGALYK